MIIIVIPDRLKKSIFCAVVEKLLQQNSGSYDVGLKVVSAHPGSRTFWLFSLHRRIGLTLQPAALHILAKSDGLALILIHLSWIPFTQRHWEKEMRS